jgi:hypothetical protein
VVHLGADRLPVAVETFDVLSMLLIFTGSGCCPEVEGITGAAHYLDDADRLTDSVMKGSSSARGFRKKTT